MRANVIKCILDEVLDIRRRRSTGGVKINDADHRHRNRPSLPEAPTTSTGNQVNPSIECNYEQKTRKLNFKIKVPGNLQAKAPMNKVVNK